MNEDLKYIRDKVDHMAEELHEVKLMFTQEITALKVKSTVYAALSGVITSLGTFALLVLKIL
jgi:hypothetical protein